MRTVAVGAGLAAYAVFAATVLWLYAPGTDDLPVALSPCPDGPHESPREVPFYEVLDAPRWIALCAELPPGPDLLVLPRLSGNAIEVTIDGQVRLRVGAPDRPANFWLQPQRVPLEGLPPRERALRLELFGHYDLGIRVAPYLTTWRGGGWRAAALSWLTEDLVALVTGLNLGVGLLLTAYGLLRRRERGEYLLLGMTSVTAALYMLDFQPGGGIASTSLFLLRRKLSLAGAYFTIAGLAAGLERTARVRWRVGATSLAAAAVLAAITLLQPDLVALKRASTWAAALVIPIALAGVVVAVRRFEPLFAALWVFFGASAVHVLLNVGFHFGHLFLLHYGILAGTLAAGLRAAIQLSRLGSDLERASRAALTDPLTGARNRAFCENLTLASTDAVAVVDFDDFKRVNDLHGHARGDRLLVDFVIAARGRLRPSDQVVRMGGDEFALLIRQADEATAARICDQILTLWRSSSADLDPSASFGVTEVGTRSFEECVARADAQMYARKSVARRAT